MSVTWKHWFLHICFLKRQYCLCAAWSTTRFDWGCLPHRFDIFSFQITLSSQMWKEKHYEILGVADWLRRSCSPNKSSWVSVTSLWSLGRERWMLLVSEWLVCEYVTQDCSNENRMSVKGRNDYFMNPDIGCESDNSLLRHGKMKVILMMK